jgi:hypothetical protein
VFVDRGAQPAVVLLISGLPRLTTTQPIVLMRHLDESAQNEVQLYRHGFLAPQGAVVVEDGHPILDRYRLRGALTAGLLDESNDVFLRFALVSTRKWLSHLAPPRRDVVANDDEDPAR